MQCKHLVSSYVRWWHCQRLGHVKLFLYLRFDVFHFVETFLNSSTGTVIFVQVKHVHADPHHRSCMVSRTLPTAATRFVDRKRHISHLMIFCSNICTMSWLHKSVICLHISTYVHWSGPVRLGAGHHCIKRSDRRLHLKFTWPIATHYASDMRAEGELRSSWCIRWREWLEALHSYHTDKAMTFHACTVDGL